MNEEESRPEAIYVSGPMRDIPNFNREAFYYAEGRLAERYPGSLIVNPARIDIECEIIDAPPEARYYVKRDLDLIMNCTHICPLDGWRNSVGARAEMAVAEWLRLGVIDLDATEVREKVVDDSGSAWCGAHCVEGETQETW